MAKYEPRWWREGWADPVKVWAESRVLYRGNDEAALPLYDSLKDWALQYWQVADDEALPLGDVQDLLGNLIKRIEQLEAEL